MHRRTLVSLTCCVFRCFFAKSEEEVREGMQDFAIPTTDNRLLVCDNKVYQVSIDWGKKQIDAPLTARQQLELKRTIAAMLLENDPRVVIEGRYFEISMRAFDGKVVRDSFSFHRGKQVLKVVPFVYRFIVNEL